MLFGCLEGVPVRAGRLPLLQRLLAAAPSPPAGDGAAAAAAGPPSPFGEGLNAAQRGCLEAAVRWRADKARGAAPAEPVLLVHGPFGSGKTTLISKIILALVDKEASGPPLRVFVAANTNVAVDRIMEALAELEFTDFLRIGSVKKIATSILQHSIHASNSKNRSATSELKAVLDTCAPTEHKKRQQIHAEILNIKRGAEKQRKKLIKEVAVIGATCCASANELLDAEAFDVAILDECSQMTEPMSLLPVVRSKAAHLIAVGDPQQLPPVLRTAAFRSAGAGSGSLARPLFQVSARPPSVGPVSGG